MRQLLPEPAEVDPVAAHAAAVRSPHPDRPWMVMNMVASADGATAVDGVSGGLGGPGDKATFTALRAVADVIVAAAGTIRAEDYGPPRTPDAIRAQRVKRGQSPYPRMAIVTGSLDLDTASELFTRAPEPPLVFTSDAADANRVKALGAVAEVHRVGPDRVNLTQMVKQLHVGAAKVVLVEGGPRLNGQLVAEGLIDELNLTTAPMLVAGSSARIVVGDIAAHAPMTLAHLWEQDGSLFARYLVGSPAG